MTAQPTPAPAVRRESPDSPVPDGAQERALDLVHSSALQHVVMADRKAGILFTLLSAALLYLFTRIPAFAWPPAGPMLLWLVVVGLLVAATALAFLVVLPRVHDTGERGVLFWGAIARHDSVESYLGAVCATTPSELARGKALFCFEISRICARKFRLLRWALFLAATGLTLFLVMLGIADLDGYAAEVQSLQSSG